ncbi:unnamed protein product [Malus baccata var. baccata]
MVVCSHHQSEFCIEAPLELRQQPPHHSQPPFQAIVVQRQHEEEEETEQVQKVLKELDIVGQATVMINFNFIPALQIELLNTSRIANDGKMFESGENFGYFLLKNPSFLSLAEEIFLS